MARPAAHTRPLEARPGRVSVEHPVDVASGAYFSTATDHALLGLVPCSIARTYHTGLLDPSPLEAAALAGPAGDAPFGPGWRASWQVELRETLEGYQFVKPDGEQVAFRVAPGRSRDPGARLFAPAAGFELRVAAPDHILVVGYGTSRNPHELHFRRTGPGGRYELLWIERTPAARLIFERDPHGRVVSLIQTRERRRWELAYDDARLRRVDVLFPSGLRRRVVDYAYDDKGRLARVGDAQGPVWSYAYDTAGRMIEERHRRGSVYTMGYDSRGRCHFVSGAGGYQERRLAWSDADRTVHVRDSHGHLTRYEVNESGQVQKLTYPSGLEERWDYDDEGVPVRRTLVNGGVLELRRDALGRVLEKIRPDGAKKVFAYDGDHHLVALTDEAGATTCFEYTAHHSIAAILTADGARTEFAFNEFAELVAVRMANGASQAFAYDAVGNRVWQTDAKGGVIVSEFDEQGRIVLLRDPAGRARLFGYDEQDRLARWTAADGRTYERHTNLAGTEVTFIRPDGRREYLRMSSCGQPEEMVDADGYTTRFSWDTEPDRVLSIENPRGDRATFAYDEDGNTLGYTTFDGRFYRYEYRHHRLARTHLPSGDTILYEHDLLGRRVRIEAGAEIVETTYGLRGELASVRAGDSLVSFDYDPRGSCIRERQDDVAFERRLDVVGNLIGLSQEGGGLDVAYEYDPLGGLRLLRYGDTLVRFWRDAMNREVARELPGAGIFEQEYDPAGRLLAQSLRRSGHEPPLLERRYAYDAAGLPATVLDSLRGHKTFFHDGRDHLTGVIAPAGMSSFYEYDPQGNRVAEWRSAFGASILQELLASDAGEVITHYSALTATHAVGPGDRLARIDGVEARIELDYDSNGRVIAKTRVTPHGRATTRFGWSPRGQLLDVTLPDGAVWQYRYDGLGRRIEKIAPTGTRVRFLWDGFRLLRELRDGTPFATWIHPPQGSCPVLRDDGAIHYVLPDGVGAPAELIARDGSIEQAVQKGPWGENFDGGGLLKQPFVGQYFDAESGLHYNTFRYYDPELGRFLSPDPLDIAGGTNLFAFVPTPVSYVDFLGLLAEVIYGHPDALGRPTGAHALITPADIGTGTAANKAIRPPGFEHGDHPYHHQRAHLIGNELGGDGNHPTNLVTMTGGSNHPDMYTLEQRVANHVRDNNAYVDLHVVPIYEGDERIPRRVRYTAVDIRTGEVIVDGHVENGKHKNYKTCAH